MPKSLQLLIESLTLRFVSMSLYELDNWRAPPNKLPYSIIWYVLEGEFIATVNGRSFTGGAGRLYHMPFQSQMACLAISQRIRFISVRFHGEISLLKSAVWSDVLNVPIQLQTDAAAAAPVIYRMLDISRNRSNAQSLLLNAKLGELIGQLLNELHPHSPNAQFERKAWPDTRVETVIEYLMCHPRQFPPLSDLCRLVHISEARLRDLFYRYTGMSPLKYIHFLKIELAKEELQATEKRISDIAYQLGFADVNYFSRLFRRMTGFSPSDYRSQSRTLR